MAPYWILKWAFCIFQCRYPGSLISCPHLRVNMLPSLWCYPERTRPRLWKKTQAVTAARNALVFSAVDGSINSTCKYTTKRHVTVTYVGRGLITDAHFGNTCWITRERKSSLVLTKAVERVLQERFICWIMWTLTRALSHTLVPLATNSLEENTLCLVMLNTVGKVNVEKYCFLHCICFYYKIK